MISSIPELGKAAPYGIYDLAANDGWVSVGMDAGHRRFRRGKHPPLVAGHRHASAIPDATRLTITSRRWRQQRLAGAAMEAELQKLADELGIDITVHHLPPGTSKWNKIEHRLFSFITMNWRAKPLVSHQVIIHLISATTTETGLKVGCELDDNQYPKGVVVSDEELAAVNIVRADFHGEWNYTIKPSNRSDRAVDS